MKDGRLYLYHYPYFIGRRSNHSGNLFAASSQQIIEKFGNVGTE